MMEVLATPEQIILLRGKQSLWFSRDGQFKCESKFGLDLDQIANIKCLGQAQLLIGRVQQDKLLLATRTQSVGRLPTVNGGSMQVQKIRRVTLLSLAPDAEIRPQSLDVQLPACPLHELVQNDANDRSRPLSPDPTSEQILTPSSLPPVEQTNDQSQQSQYTPVSKTWNSIKSTSGRFIGKASSVTPISPSTTLGLSVTDGRDRLERRILDELVKMFSESDSFYFSEDGDLTNTLQRSETKLRVGKPKSPHESFTEEKPEKIAYTESLDERFFFNKHMLAFLDENDELARSWIVPVIQGFVQIERCRLPASSGDQFSANWSPVDTDVHFDLALISRRSRHRAGTRYKKRGVDEEGHVANYVETEQLFCTEGHVLSFVQTRGSVPVFWAQPGVSYRPAPVLEKSANENREAFSRHFEQQFSVYGSVTAVNLVEQSGREKPLSDAYLNNVLDLDDDRLTYVSFDFHEICRGMRFENVVILIDQLNDQLREMRYFWRDRSGPVCEQRGIFRVNCVDCLDRTNLVQSALAKAVLQTQLSRLAMLAPDVPLPAQTRRAFQTLWANNGDAISRQYAGTSALKGDFTRTGERRLAGMMRDSYNSASRYYQNRFKDAYRQAAIDTLLGLAVSEPELQSPDSERPISEEEEQEALQREQERLRQMVDHCRKMCIGDSLSEPLLGAWAMLNAQHAHTDCVLLLSKDCYYLVDYDELRERILRCQCVLLEDLERIELGPQSWGGPGLFSGNNFSRSPNGSLITVATGGVGTYCLRIHYLFSLQSGFFHLLQANPNGLQSGVDAAAEQLRAIVQAFKLALSVRSINVPLFEGKLERRRSKRPEVAGESMSGRVGRVKLGVGVLRQAGERNLRGLKSAGRQAINNVSNQFARFRGRFARAPADATSQTRVDGVTIVVPDESSDEETLDAGDEEEEEEVEEEVEGEVEEEDDEVEDDEDLPLDDDEYEYELDGHESMIRDSRSSTKNTSIELKRHSQLNLLSCQSSSECSDLFESLDTHSSNKSDVFDHMSTEPQSMPPVYSIRTQSGEDQPHSLLESCGILTSSHEWQDNPQLSSTVSDSAESGAGLKPEIEITPVSIPLSELKLTTGWANVRPLSRSTVQLSAASSGMSSGMSGGNGSVSGSVSVLPLGPTNSLPGDQISSVSCASIAFIGQAGGMRTGDSIPGRFANEKLLESGETISELKDYTRSNLDISQVSCNKNNVRMMSGRMKNSQSECCIQESPAEPISNAKRDLILNPLSRIARGYLNLNRLNPQQLIRRGHSNQQLDEVEYERLKQRKQNCRSKIIEI